MAEFFEDGNERARSIKCGEFLDYLSDGYWSRKFCFFSGINVLIFVPKL